MRESSGALNFHDALIVVAWEAVGFDALISFDRDFDAIYGMERLGSSADVRRWLSA
jgi:predicted nucleic acid-binding protein